MQLTRLICCLLVLAFAGPEIACAQTPTPRPAMAEEAVRAAFLLNFARFTEWPKARDEADTSLFVVGVVGNREVEDYLWQMGQSQRINGRTLKVVRVLGPKEVAACHLVYVAPDATKGGAQWSLDEWLAGAQGRPVLMVSAVKGFLSRGGMINFYTETANLRFEINHRAALAAGLTLSSRLVALSRPPKEGAP